MTRPGAGMGNAPVLALKEAIEVGMRVLWTDAFAVDELVGREDMYATEGRAAELKASLLSVLDPRSSTYVSIQPTYPVADAAKFPFISLIENGGGENSSELVMGDLLRESYDLQGTELVATATTGGGERTTVQVGIWDLRPDRATLLQASVRWALVQQKTRLQELGVHDLSVSTGGVRVEGSLAPRIPYCPMLSVTLLWTLRASHRRKVPNRITLLAPSVGS